MKKLVSLFAIVAVLLAAAPRGQSQDVSVDFFYDNLNGGSWLEVGDYGYCWQPDLAVNDPTWRPYADGYWAYTDEGWTWISYEDFGWATYHYGRWVKLAEYGWVWKPGYEWGPAWVSWRTGGNYIGWAPLPPETEYVYESRPLAGHLDVEFDIGPAYYNFCDVRYIGEPVLRSRLIPYQQNVTYVSQTVNVTNVTYKNKTVYNYGPDINVLNQYSSRPIQRLKLERQANVDVATAAKGGGLTKVQGNALVVAAPSEIKKPAKEIAPPTVKTKVAEAKVEKGWSIAGDPNAQTQLKEKLKSEDLKNIPPPTLGMPANTKASASPGAGGASAGQQVVGSPLEKGKGKNKNKAAQVQNAGAAGASTSPLTNSESPKREKKKQKNAQQAQSEPTNPSVTGAAAETSASEMPDSGKPGKGGKAKRADKFGGTPTVPAAVSSPEGIAAPEGKPKRNQYQPQNAVSGPTETAGTGEAAGEPRGQNRKFMQQQPTAPPSGQPGGYGAPAGGGAMQQSISDEPGDGMKNKKFDRQQQGGGPPPSSQVGAPASGQPLSAVQQGGEPKHEGKKKDSESPAPTPQ